MFKNKINPAVLISLIIPQNIQAVEVLPQAMNPAQAQQVQITRQAARSSSIEHLRAQIGQTPSTPTAQLTLTTEDRAQIAQGNTAAAFGAPLKIGLVKPLGLAIDLKALNINTLTEQTTPYLSGLARRANGQVAWVMRLDVTGSAGVRILIDNARLPPGASLSIYNESGEVRGPYQGSNRQRFWTQTISGGQIYIQLEQPEQNPGTASFTVRSVLLLDQSTPLFCPETSSCVEDASCHQTSEWPALDQARKAVALIHFVTDEGSFLCTGGLLADTDFATTIPYFLTANHCISNQAEAETIEALFQYQTPSCGGTCPEHPYQLSTLGATLIGHSAVDDHSLLMLDEDPPADSWFLGWMDQAVANAGNTPLFRISHPKGAPQAFSSHLVDTNISTTDFCGTTNISRGSYIFSRNVLGTVEPGSSGAPVMLWSGQVVGQLFGSCGYNLDDTCDAENNRTVDGAFAHYASAVMPWLNPDPQALPLLVIKQGTGSGRVQATLNSEVQTQTQVVSGVRPLLFGGHLTETTDRPWHAGLKINLFGIGGAWNCSGTVVAPEWVVTAAHCIVDAQGVTISPTTIEVRTGSNRFEFGGQVSKVQKILKYPDFNLNTQEHDLALLKLSSPVFVQPLRPVTLEREQQLACLNTNGMITGWTATPICGLSAIALSEVNAKLVKPSRCQHAYPKRTITSDMLCTQTDTSKSELCQTDEGGPLVVDNGRGGFAQAGVISFDAGCNADQTFTIHTRLANYVSWLEDMTKLDLSSEVGPGVIDCGITCEARYPTGTVLTLTATPDPGMVFGNWDGACSGTDTTCHITMTQASRVKAVFHNASVNDSTSTLATCSN